MSEFYTVSQINRFLKNIIEAEPFLSDIWIRGEISNFKAHYSGHLYLTLKDETSTLKCVMFKSDALRLKLRPEDGMKVLVRARISVYEAAGSYQAYIREMKSDGLGDLYVAFEQLKKKLEAEGLFDEKYKKQIPPYPEKIGVITSLTGAAVQDIKNILGRRYPIGELILYPSLVQGEDAPADIVKGIKFFNEKCPVDVLIVGRGGGSIEDLWAFNDEKVARAVFESSVPVISAVGHETDFTICDFVSDLRAPTPSAAAELAAVPVTEIKAQISFLHDRISSLFKGIISEQRASLSYFDKGKILSRLADNIAAKRTACDAVFDKIYMLMKNKTAGSRSALALASARLEGASPLKIMEKGYAAALKGGKAVRKVTELKKGDEIELVFADGKAAAEITKLTKSEKRND